MRKLIVPVLLVVLPFRISSQNALRDDLNGVYYDPALYVQQLEIEDGSPYLNLEFQPAKIGDREKIYLVRFDGYKGNIEVWLEEDRVIILQITEEEKVQLLDGSNKCYVQRDYQNQKNETKSGFLEVIESSEAFTLFKKESIKYFKKTKAEGYAPAKPARFERTNHQFYLKLSDGEMPFYLPSNKKKFLAVFETKTATKAKSLIKRERLNLTVESDVVRILSEIYDD